MKRGHLLAIACLIGLCISSGVGRSHEVPPPIMEPGDPTPSGEARCEEGIAVAGPVAFPCREIDLVARLPFQTILNDVWGWTDPQTGTDYAIVGVIDGAAFVSLEDPEQPVLLGVLPSASGLSFWADIKVFRDHAYIVKDFAGDHGLQVFDLTQLRDVHDPPRTFEVTDHYTGFGRAHNIAIDEESGFAYAVGSNTCGGGLHILDLADPARPTFAGCFSEDGYTHDAQCVVYRGPDADHAGEQICFDSDPAASNSPEDTLTIVDVTDKAAPRLISRTGYDDSAYAHQGWLTEDHAFFLLGDEGDEIAFDHGARTYVWDVSDLDAPVLVGHYTSDSPVTDHNLYIQGDFVFEANYASGLRILHLHDPAAVDIEEAAFFDTWPLDDRRDYLGAWSVFPFFDSGLVIVSDMVNGLFVLRPRIEHGPEPVRIDVRQTVIQPGSRGIVPVVLFGSETFDVGEVDPASLGFGPGRAGPLSRGGGHPTDFDNDGFADLLSRYRIPEAGISPGEVEACVTGETLDGARFEGCDSIRTVPRM